MNSLSEELRENGQRQQEKQNFSSYQKEICYKYAPSVTNLLKTQLFSTFYFPYSSMWAQTFLLLLAIQQEKNGQGMPFCAHLRLYSNTPVPSLTMFNWGSPPPPLLV